MDPIALTTAKVAAILNTASGSCEASAERTMRDLLAEVGIQEPKIWCGDASYMEEAFAGAAEHAPHILIVLGGDGTIRSAAEACAGTDTLLIALPGGTMNMLPKALYGNRSWEEALRETLRSPQVISVSGGRVEDKQFFIAAIIGSPALWARAREALRNRDIATALAESKTALERLFADKLHYSFSDSEEGEAEAVTVICPLISDALANTERTFEAAVIEVNNAIEVAALASSAAFGAWRDNTHVSIVKTRTVTVSGNGDLPLILDGETVEVGNEVRIEFVEEAFKVLAPKSL